ncbi:MAG: recombinase family protein [Candidatus Nitricoxidivorans perseverans]|uniref:Recombinase family protein n=1 Tax=Candidatus Nitricoxidivorans perseverans TaxID=2975601 RepID=A0AA49FM20_9PROT|nr:MAG: recombinase family protein [Candidatus Nitricoxidivorans perseverans]
MANGKFVAYYRVSTQKQGASGLGLEAQKAAVESYLNGGHWELIGEYTEVETGGGANALDKRPQLKAALAAAKKAKATLVIAKLDRLARNVHFVTGLLETGVEFVAADMPHANKMMIQIHAVMSEYERDQIKARTKAAYDAKKARLAAEGKAFINNLVRCNTKRQQDADQFVDSIRPTIETLKASGLSQRGMVAALNQQGTPAPKGGSWSLLQLQRCLSRLS